VAGISRDGRLLAYTSNRDNGVDFDLWTCDLESRDHRLLYAAGTWLVPGSGISPDGRYISLLSEGTLALDSDLHLVELATGTATIILPHPGVSAQLGAPAWITPDRFAVAANIDSDTIAIHSHDLRDATTQPLAVSDPRRDAEVVSSHDGSRILVIENDGGRSTMRLLAGVDGEAPRRRRSRSRPTNPAWSATTRSPRRASPPTRAGSTTPSAAHASPATCLPTRWPAARRGG
jgi:Tol biopolymer transport system component